MQDSDIKVVGLSSNKSKGKTNWKIIGAIIGIIVLAIGVVAGIILVKQQQNISEKASELMCTNPLAEQCPGVDGVLRNCHPPENSGGPTESRCDTANRVEFCGSKCFACPAVNGEWREVNISLCGPTATPTSVATATSLATATTVATPTSSTSTCLPRVYFNTVTTDANGDNAGTCKPSTKTFDANNVSCDGTNQTCDQYLAALSVSTGVTKVQGGCFANTAACVSPDGKTVSFRFFYDTVKKICISTNHRYDSQDTDVDDVNHGTCLSSLNQYQPNARKKCYTSKPSCASDNALSTATATATATATSISTSSSEATATSTSASRTATPTSSPTAAPIPVTGIEWPTLLGAGFGIMMILASLALAI